MKNRTLNEIRQSKEYQLDENKEFFMQAVRAQSKEYQQAVELSDQGGKYTVPSKGHAAVALKEIKASKNPFSHADVDNTVKVIIENLKNEMYDIVFQAVCDEMNQHAVFDSSEYLTEAGLELFEDEWFEFYHENHGEIIHEIIKDLQ